MSDPIAWKTDDGEVYITLEALNRSGGVRDLNRVSYGQALELHRVLGEVLGLTHPAPKSPLTASKATPSHRQGQWRP